MLGAYADIATDFERISDPIGPLLYINSPLVPANAHSAVLSLYKNAEKELRGAVALREPDKTNSPKNGCS